MNIDINNTEHVLRLLTFIILSFFIIMFSNCSPISQYDKINNGDIMPIIIKVLIIMVIYCIIIKPINNDNIEKYKNIFNRGRYQRRIDNYNKDRGVQGARTKFNVKCTGCGRLKIMQQRVTENGYGCPHCNGRCNKLSNKSCGCNKNNNKCHNIKMCDCERKYDTLYLLSDDYVHNDSSPCYNCLLSKNPKYTVLNYDTLPSVNGPPQTEYLTHEQNYHV